MKEKIDLILEIYPFLKEIVDQIHNIDRMDERNWDNSFEKEFTKYSKILKILKENNLID